MRAYRSDLAHVHDRGFGTLARAAAASLIGELHRAGIRGGLVVDLGCGSGILSAAVAAAGFDVLGIDLSPAMLAIARRRVPGGRFRRGSLFAAAIPPCVAVAAAGECINYLFDRGNTLGAAARLFARVHAALAPGGLLQFDAAEPGRVRGPGPQRSYVEGRGWAVLVCAEEDGRRLTRTITSFRKVGALYRRDEEVHRLRLLPRREMVTALRRSGFGVRVLRSYGALPLPPGLVGYRARSKRLRS